MKTDTKPGVKVNRVKIEVPPVPPITELLPPKTISISSFSDEIKWVVSLNEFYCWCKANTGPFPNFRDLSFKCFKRYDVPESLSPAQQEAYLTISNKYRDIAAIDLPIEITVATTNMCFFNFSAPSSSTKGKAILRAQINGNTLGPLVFNICFDAETGCWAFKESISYHQPEIVPKALETLFVSVLVRYLSQFGKPANPRTLHNKTIKSEDFDKAFRMNMETTVIGD